MTHKLNVSVAIATFNEKDNIIRCLDAVHDWVDEIIIVDGQSTDGTPELVKKYKKVKLIQTTNKPNFHINNQMAIDACTSSWILQLDADEVVTPALKREIISISTKSIDTIKTSGFWIKRKNYFLGRFLTKGGVYPDPTIRFYKNGQAKLPCKDVHEQAQVDGPVDTLKNDLLHYADPTFSRYLLRSNRYTTLLAQELKQNQTSISFFSFLNYFIFKPTFWFLLSYFRHRGYVDGFPGFVFSLFSSLRFPIAYIKYWELRVSKNNIDLVKDWN